MKKCRELNSEIVNNQAKIKTALRLSQEDQQTITHLQKEMEKTWKLVSMSQEKETRAKETIQHLKDEMTNLSKLVERGAGISISQENVVKELKLAKEELQRQVDEQAESLSMLETQLMSQHKVQEDLRTEKDSALAEMAALREKLASKEAEIVRESKRRQKTHLELMDVRRNFDEKLKYEEKLLADIAQQKGEIGERDRHLMDAKATMDKYIRDYEALFTRTQKVTEDLENQVTRNKELYSDMVKVEKELKLKTVEAGRLGTDKSTLERKLDKEHRDVLLYKQLADDAKIPLQLAQAEIDSLKKDLIMANRLEMTLEKTAEKFEKEKEFQTNATLRAQQQTKEQTELVLDKERNMSALTKEVIEYQQELGRLRKAASQLEKERERLANEVADGRSNNVSLSEQGKLKEATIDELKKQITQWEAKLRQQQQLYEAVRSDRNHYSKGLIEAQDEIAELRKKFKIMGHQIEQLKEEISAKDQALVKEHFEVQRADSLKDAMQGELNLKNQISKRNEELIRQQEIELKKLAVSIRRMDDESLAQRKEYDQVINERDILGTQLIRRNDELALLYEKLRVQESALTAGESQYMSRVDDIRLLRMKVKELNREVMLGKGSGDKTNELKREILHLQKDLLQEKTKVTALSEELENPMNVHRWRKLEGSDPATFELIQKIQTLQRRLISKTEEVVEKGLVILEKEKLYRELKQILSRQPGPEVAEQLTVYQHSLRNKSKQLKAMASELNMYQAQVNEYKYEIERVTRELQDLKRKYYQQKRRDQLMQELDLENDHGGGNALQSQSFAGASLSSAGDSGPVAAPGKAAMSRTAPQSLQNDQIMAAKSARTRFTGGGFAIK